MPEKAGGSKMDTLFKLILFCVISVLSFSIGAFVGKKVSDVEHREAALDSEKGGARDTASVEHAEGEAQPEEALSEEEISSLTDEFVKVEKANLKDKEKMPNPIDEKRDPSSVEEGHEAQKGEHAETTDDGYKKINKHGEAAAEEKGEAKAHEEAATHGEAAKEEAAPHAKKSAHEEPASTAATRVAAGMAPTKDTAKERKPDSVFPVNPTSAVGKFTLQVAAYSTEEEAKNHVNNLKSKGYSAFYIPGQAKGQTWYRVSIGLFPSYDNALAFRKEREKEDSIRTSFIQKIVN